ncbi:plastid division2 [Tasmannia lanceolata]|uniref:plastid division2 n=1 Tax=Tasmannia lanceolata TaxID=3420 RepID=UPI004064B9ED
MEGDEISVVLARVSELRSKINNCIEKTTLRDNERGENEEDSQFIDNGREPDEEADSLFSIRDALESLELQLVSLQALQQQQQYEREASLAEIDRSRKYLLKKLKDYKGEDLEVIREASAFAGETVEHNDDLLLPPYPSRLPDSLILDDSYHSHFSSIPNKSIRNGVSGSLKPEEKRTPDKSEKKPTQPASKNSPTGIRLVLGLAAKTVFTLVSVISILSLAGFEPRLGKRNTQFKVLELVRKPADEEKQGPIQCPPGKVLVIEDGKPRCLVKERVEIPFEPVVMTPDVSYGCG